MTGVSLARTLMQRCDAPASYGEESGRLTRPFATPSMLEAEVLSRFLMLGLPHACL
jgi:hypothetical protein